MTSHYFSGSDFESEIPVQQVTDWVNKLLLQRYLQADKRLHC